MAKQTSTAAPRPVRRSSVPPKRVVVTPSRLHWSIPFTTPNYLILGCGVLMLGLAYYLMSTSIGPDPAANMGIWDKPIAVSIAPILLALAYCVVIPFGILYRPREEEKSEERGGAGTV